jgi:hypothetical protein
MVRPAQLSARLILAIAICSPSFVHAQAPAASNQPIKTAGAATQPANQAVQQHRPAKRGKKTAEPEVTQTQPAPPPTPEQMPPSPPKVIYQSGQLTIDSANATLAQVLRSVQSKTGASMEIPSSANNERVVAQLGPGRPSDVLASLLNGSKFDFIILGVQNQPGTVQKVILSTRQNTAPTTNTAQNRAPAPTPQDEAQAEEDYNQPEPPPAEDNAAENQNQPQPQVAPGVYRPNIPGQPNQNAEFPAQVPPGAEQQGSQQGVKSPEQLLQELQRMQQQQQMYQQQLNPANQNPQPVVQPPQEPQ